MPRACRKRATDVKNSPGKAQEIGTKSGSAAVPKTNEVALSATSSVTNFYLKILSQELRIDTKYTCDTKEIEMFTIELYPSAPLELTRKVEERLRKKTNKINSFVNSSNSSQEMNNRFKVEIYEAKNK